MRGIVPEDRRAHLSDRKLYKLFYDQDMTEGHLFFPARDEPRLLWVSENIAPTDDVVDIGCHKGELTFRARTLTNGYVAGVDISPKAISQAATFAFTRGVFDISWRVGEAEALPYPNNSFDVAILAEILEHVPDPSLCLLEAERVVRSGGKIVISSPINAEKMDEVDAVERRRRTGFDLDMHVREYDPSKELEGKHNLFCKEESVVRGLEGNSSNRFSFYLAKYEVKK